MHVIKRRRQHIALVARSCYVGMAGNLGRYVFGKPSADGGVVPSIGKEPSGVRSAFENNHRLTIS